MEFSSSRPKNALLPAEILMPRLSSASDNVAILDEARDVSFEEDEGTDYSDAGGGGYMSDEDTDPATRRDPPTDGGGLQ